MTRPGVVVTGTDTGVGKTLVACGIASAVKRELEGYVRVGVGAARPGEIVQHRGGGPREQAPWASGGGVRVGVFKPMGTGCRRDREGLVCEDAEALAHFADCRLPLETICPVRYAEAVSPAAAAEMSGEPVDWGAVARAMARLEAESDAVVVEGIGGVMVPLDPFGRRALPDASATGRASASAWGQHVVTVLDLIQTLGYPVVVVARSGLGTLNHTALTVWALQSAGVAVAGVVMNQYEADAALEPDASVGGNRAWIERMTGVPVLAVVPRVEAKRARPERGVIDLAAMEALEAVSWAGVMRRAVNR